MTVSYDGSRYNGWQKLPSTTNTLQETIETTLSKIFEQPITIHASGRTDAGVHALAQVFDFKCTSSEYINLRECDSESNPQTADELLLISKINEILPDDIHITSVSLASNKFHSRLSAISKTYEYRIDSRQPQHVFGTKYYYYCDKPINIARMQEAATSLIGSHDFRSFCSEKNEKKSTVRTITDIEIIENDGLITLRYTGDGFLYNMVRILTGTLLEVGIGKRNAFEVANILAAKRREVAGVTLPAHGLFLIHVNY